MQLVRPGIDAALIIKDHAVKAIREKWPEDIADRCEVLIREALNVLYVAANSLDYFEVPATEISVNVWIESFSTKTIGRFGGLATTDPVLFKLLVKHRLLNSGAAKGLLFLPVSEVIAQGGRQSYTSYMASSIMVQSPYPLPAGLTRLISYDTISPAQRGPNDKLAEMCIKLFMTVNYHLSMKWPVWVAEHPTGPVFVFGFNPVLDVRCSATALQGACRSLEA